MTTTRLTNCLFCGEPGREVIKDRQWRCDPCESTWSPWPVYRETPATGLNWADPLKQDYTFVPYIDHATENIPCP